MGDRPAAPEDVRVVLRDGTEIPCEIYYGGHRDGEHRWIVTAAVPPLGWVDHVAIGVLPAHTGIEFRIYGGEEPS
ncbi:MAG: hypothetical protein J2P43_01170 [Candidatus Dormibacteraeota bacterium]|nr:hypothetical protein [Candidatus Dormibacteraeota bacterium]